MTRSVGPSLQITEKISNLYDALEHGLPIKTYSKRLFSRTLVVIQKFCKDDSKQKYWFEKFQRIKK